jgi:hypothetical protein
VKSVTTYRQDGPQVRAKEGRLCWRVELRRGMEAGLSESDPNGAKRDQVSWMFTVALGR